MNLLPAYVSWSVEIYFAIEDKKQLTFHKQIMVQGAKGKRRGKKRGAGDHSESFSEVGKLIFPI